MPLLPQKGNERHMSKDNTQASCKPQFTTSQQSYKWTYGSST